MGQEVLSLLPEDTGAGVYQAAGGELGHSTEENECGGYLGLRSPEWATQDQKSQFLQEQPREDERWGWSIADFSFAPSSEPGVRLSSRVTFG